MGLYRFLFVFMDSNGYLWVLKGPHASLLVLMGPYRFFCVSMDSSGSLWVLISPYSSLWILMGSYDPLCMFWVVMCLHRF